MVNGSDLIGGTWSALPGSEVESRNPAHPDRVIWRGTPSLTHVDSALDAARSALKVWSRWEPESRFAVLRRYAEICDAKKTELAGLIADETGKAMWDAASEAGFLSNKVTITLDATEHGPLRRVTPFDVTLSKSRVGRTRFMPHGVMSVIAPYNFPAHLANGHIVPALATGNTVVLKPSEKSPAVGQFMAEMFNEALAEKGAPPGVVNLVHGGAATASRLTTDSRTDGVLFTGSWAVGRRILEANLDRPGRIVALEMGGNNPAIVMDDANTRQALIEVARSAFVTTGQRCTCTRRLIVHEKIADKFIASLVPIARELVVGDPRAASPVFMGPTISEHNRLAILKFCENLDRSGASFDLRPHATGNEGWYITPGIARVERFVASEPPASSGNPLRDNMTFDPGSDIEVFGPVLRYCVVRDLEEAIQQANATRYGLAASIFTRSERAADEFFSRVRAGCLNVNTGTAGASSKLPFGGLGLSGNHRPAGSFSLDYCAVPVAGMIERGDDAALPAGMSLGGISV